MSPACDLLWNLPLTRLPPWFPGQMGVPGTDNETGLRNHSTGSVFYVDPNFPGASDQRDGTNPDDPLLTVAAALTHCQPYRGDVIAVMWNNAWQYGNAADGYRTPIQESATVTVPGVRIVGVALSGSIGVPWLPAASLGTCINVAACDVLIEGFVFTAGNVFVGADAIYAEWDGTTCWADNLTVRHCTFDGSIDVAIQMEYVWYANIYGCFFQECDTQGIYVDPAGSGISYCQIYDNVFHDCTAAMAMRGATNNHIHGNSIFNSNAQGAALATDEGIDLTGAGSDNQVYDNYFSCLLPVPANGDWNDLNTAGDTDAWIGNHCMNGLAITNPT